MVHLFLQSCRGSRTTESKSACSNNNTRFSKAMNGTREARDQNSEKDFAFAERMSRTACIRLLSVSGCGFELAQSGAPEYVSRKKIRKTAETSTFATQQRNSNDAR